MKSYYNQQEIASNFRKFFKNFFTLSKPHLNLICFIVTGIISAESVVTADIARKLKDDFSNINMESIERRFRRFFYSFSSIAYNFYNFFITYIVSKYVVKHSDSKVHITFDHMFCKNKFTILLFSLRIGKQGIPLWFRCFKYKSSSEAYKINLINEGISYCHNLFANKNYHIIFLADRWFSNVAILSHIESLNAYYCVRSKSYFTYTYTNSKGELITSHLRDIKPLKFRGKFLENVFFTRKMFKTNIVISNSSNTDEPWILLTNDKVSQAIKNYSYRFGSIECIFKSQKSNGFRLESTNTQKLEHFISLFTIMCVALVWLTIIGVDYVKNKHNYKLKFRDVRKHKNGSTTRLYSFFNLGLSIFNRCYYNHIDFKLKFNFILYDI